MSLNSKQAAREHVLAVSRDFISQPRLSKYISIYEINTTLFSSQTIKDSTKLILDNQYLD